MDVSLGEDGVRREDGRGHQWAGEAVKATTATASAGPAMLRGGDNAGPVVRPPDCVASMVEVVLVNGRTLRVAETIAPEVLGRLAVALEG